MPDDQFIQKIPANPELNPEKTLIAEMDKRYEERRALVEVPDESLSLPVFRDIQDAHERGVDIREEYSGKSMAHVSGQELFFRCLDSPVFLDNKSNAELSLFLLRNKPLINVGSGGAAENLLFARRIAGIFESNGCSIIDPYFNQSKTDELIYKNHYEKHLQFTQDDALHYLIKSETGSSNVFFSAINVTNIDHTVGRSNSVIWLKRVAQEAYRVIPENGVLICIESDDIAHEAEEIFGKENRIDFGIGFSIFVKGDWRRYAVEKEVQITSAMKEIEIIIKETNFDLSFGRGYYYLRKYIKSTDDNKDKSRLSFLRIWEMGKELMENYEDMVSKYGDTDENVIVAKRLLDAWEKNVKF